MQSQLFFLTSDWRKMDIFFADPSEVPLPPEEVRIRKLKADPSPDGKRVRVYLEVDPFQKRPSAELNLFDSSGRQIASVDIIETMNRKIDLNVHLRGAVETGEYLPDPSIANLEPVERQIVDRAQEKVSIRV
jgi:hypothetical protein